MRDIEDSTKVSAMPNAMPDDNFYTTIPAIHNLSDIADETNYYDAPNDWMIAVTDIQGSTKAIENGRYKDVNVIAAASITAILNVSDGVELPYVFGGDGAITLIPSRLRPAVREVLLATQTLAKTSFNLDMRVGIVPVRDVLIYGSKVRVAKLHISEKFEQALFLGGGVSRAERMLKMDSARNPYLLRQQADETVKASFEGLECRWNQIPSPSEETVSLLVIATPNNSDTYRDVLHKIEDIYGDSHARHPVSLKGLKLRLFPWEFRTEALVRFGTSNLRTLWRMAKNTFLARIAMRFDLQGWGQYKPSLLQAIDNEKFDDALRMTIAGTAYQRRNLTKYLEEQHARKHLIYGIHASSHAIMTCLVFDYFGKHVHFIDGADGGYARAAVQLKAQMKDIETDDEARPD